MANRAGSTLQLHLPNEILEMIFMNLLGDPTVDWHSRFRRKDIKRFVNNMRRAQPADFLLVCRQWAQVILHNRRLWTTVLVDSWMIRERGPEVVRAKIKAHLQRSGNEPLDVIHVTIRAPFQSSWEAWKPEPSTAPRKSLSRRQICDLLEVVAGQGGQEMKRWKSCILAWSAVLDRKSCWLMSHFLTYPTPLLESLCIWNVTSGHLPIFPDTPVLKRLVSTGYHYQIGAGVPLPCTESAYISNRRLDGNCSRFGRLAVRLLRRISEVRFLNILDVAGVLPSRLALLDNEEPLRFPNLVDLRLEGGISCFLIRKLKAPRLNSLTLHFKCGAGHEELLGHLAEADLPELSRLDLDLTKNDDPHWTLGEVGPSVIGMLSTKETLRTVIGTADLEGVVAGCREMLPSFLPRLVFSLRV